MASVDQLVDASNRVQCAAVSPIGVLFWLQIGLENRFEHQNRCHFRCPLSVIGQRKWQRFWCSNLFSRPICSQNSTPIGETAAHWTRLDASTSCSTLAMKKS